MTFCFDWQDPEEMTAFKVLEEGEATFKVHDVVEATSKKTGEAMLKVVLSVTDSKGANSFVDDYILSSHPWKLKNLCWAINKPEIYTESSDGKLNPMRLVAEKGKCIIKTDKPDNPNFQERSVIAKYLDAVKEAEKNKKHEAEQARQDNLPDDPLPF